MSTNGKKWPNRIFGNYTSRHFPIISSGKLYKMYLERSQVLEFSLSPSQFLAPGGKGERVEIRSRSNDGTAGDQCDRIMEGRLVAVTLSCTIPGCLGSVSRC